jgi:nucleoside-diphosphate-sugar epimerase
MIVALAGAHGKIAMRLTALLSRAGDEVIGLIRNPDHAADVERQGASPVVCDLEHASVEEIAAAITGADAAVFAAGAGPGSGAERKLSMDRDGAIKLLEASQAAGVPRFLIISSVGAEDPPPGDDVFSVYLRAKAEADQAVQVSDRDWTIVRPGRLTLGPGQGRVRIDLEPFRGEIPRDDVAALLALLLKDARSVRMILYVNSGSVPLAQALEAVLQG